MNNIHPVFTGIIGQHFPVMDDGDREPDPVAAEYDPDPAPVRELITDDPDAVAAAMLFNRQQEGGK